MSVLKVLVWVGALCICIYGLGEVSKRIVRYCDGNNVRKTDEIEGRSMGMMCSHEAIGNIDIKTNDLHYFVAISTLFLHASSSSCSTYVTEKKRITIIITYNTLLSSTHYRRYP